MPETVTQNNTLETAQSLGLLEEEYDHICQLLGRTPNFTELSIYSVMWSEHCSYKNSIKWLKTLPKEGEQILAEAGEENAGLVDIGDGWACAFKIESHNHPSAIEPYQGAATGVGGINRDIFTMGARPIAQLNSLRFGDLSDKRTQWLLRGVVKGIGDYGNSFGIPVVGGEVYFDPVYQTNPLVNAMSIGIVKREQTLSAIAEGVGNPVFIVGSSTGKDGIHGATFASGDITEDSAEDLPSVQVGDPFMEKLLLEATLELAQTDCVVGMQDMGAAGITCSTSEMAAKGECGMEIHLDKVPTRQQGMQPFEILLSESQERMLVVVKKGREQEVQDIFDKWDLNCVQIGEVTAGDQLRYYMNGECVAEVSAQSLVLGGGAPIYDRPYEEPAYVKQAAAFDDNNVSEPSDLKQVAWELIAYPNIASKKWVIRQYDSMVGTANMTTNFPTSAGVVNLKGSNRAIATSVDCNARFVHASPRQGAAMAVAEAARNIVCSGGKPLAITNCLNFGNPYNPNVYWQFVEAIQGMGEACKKLNTPVTGGNVSFYNQTSIGGTEDPVFPTPTIGMIGLIENKAHITPLSFQSSGDLIYMIGDTSEDLGSSEYLVNYHRVQASPAPSIDLDKEVALQQAVHDLIQSGVINSAHDCSEGGLMVTLLEKGFHKTLGFSITLPDGIARKDAFLFGESPSRVVVSINPENQRQFEEKVNNAGLPQTFLGEVQDELLTINGLEWGSVAAWKDRYDNALEGQL